MVDLVHPAVHAANTIADYSAAQKFLRRGLVRRNIWFGLLLPIALALLTLFLAQNALLRLFTLNPEISVWIAGPLALYVYFRTAQFTSQFRYKSMLHPGGPFLTPTDLTVAPEGLFLRSDRGEGRVDWHAILKIEETATHIYFFFDHVMAQVIAKRSFASPAAAGEFLSTAQRYFDAAHERKT